MCGIAGLRALGGQGPTADELMRMAAALQHRGPNGHGFFLDEGIGLAHTRLALVDLTGGAQPLTNEDDSIWVVGNGEIYDHEAWRAELRQRGHHFRSRSDIEILVHAYEEWGEAAWSRLDGQFAFALWDARRQQLHLVRDRFGILPLHFAQLPNTVLFASEAKALFASGRLQPAFDASAVHQVFTLWSCLPPRSVFTGVMAVAPGSAVVFDAELRPRHTTWWQLDLAARHDGPENLAAAGEQLESHLRTAVRRRLAADVPVGGYLSGGLDSSVLTALAASEGATIDTFALRFQDPVFDETAAQRRVSSLLGTRHHEVLVTDDDIRAALPEVVWHCETPLLRTAPVPMFLLSALVRHNGIRAVLTGEGADELLGGYSIFLEDKVRRFWARQPESAARPALLSRVHEFVGTSEQRASRMWQAFYGSGLLDTADPFYAHSLRWQNTAWTKRVLRPLAGEAATREDHRQQLMALLPQAFSHWRPLARAQAVEIAAFLSSYLLASQGDRVAMGHGIEARYPFLDADVAAFCAGLPDRFKVRGLRTKVALREVAARHLPADVWQRKKQPYRAPVASALFAPGATVYAEDLLSAAKLRANELVDAGTALVLVDKCRRAHGQVSERESMALCGLLTLQLLREHFFVGLPQRIDGLVRDLGRRRPDVFVHRRFARHHDFTARARP